jgi:hypothetical protein
LKLPELPEPQIYDGYAWKAPFSKYDYFTAAQMLAIRDQGVAYGMEAGRQAVEWLIRMDAAKDHDELAILAAQAGDWLRVNVAAIRSKAVQNTVQVSGKEGV